VCHEVEAHASIRSEVVNAVAAKANVGEGTQVPASSQGGDLVQQPQLQIITDTPNSVKPSARRWSGASSVNPRFKRLAQTEWRQFWFLATFCKLLQSSRMFGKCWPVLK
jgi:hypothetical protein